MVSRPPHSACNAHLIVHVISTRCSTLCWANWIRKYFLWLEIQTAAETRYGAREHRREHRAHRSPRVRTGAHRCAQVRTGAHRRAPVRTGPTGCAPGCALFFLSARPFHGLHGSAQKNMVTQTCRNPDHLMNSLPCWTRSSSDVKLEWPDRFSTPVWTIVVTGLGPMSGMLAGTS